VPKTDDHDFFEKLVMEGFQAGLSWITVLRKREAFRAAFDGFNPERMAAYDGRKMCSLLENPGIIRHRGKIEAAMHNARAYLKLREKTSFSAFLWRFVNGEPIQNNYASMGQVPPHTPLSHEMSKALKAEGFKFAGPVMTYALMQSCGLVNDHLTDCFRHKQCAHLAKTIPQQATNAG
jgi:DNA-3-methyladenine glycosylase I